MTAERWSVREDDNRYRTEVIRLLREIQAELRRLHNAMKPSPPALACSKCGKEFGTKAALARHEKACRV